MWNIHLTDGNCVHFCNVFLWREITGKTYLQRKIGTYGRSLKGRKVHQFCSARIQTWYAHLLTKIHCFIYGQFTQYLTINDCVCEAPMFQTYISNKQLITKCLLNMLHICVREYLRCFKVNLELKVVLSTWRFYRVIQPKILVK